MFFKFTSLKKFHGLSLGIYLLRVYLMLDCFYSIKFKAHAIEKIRV